ncbi:MAG: hypothetical protein BIFFINMI_02226 [Phycisphaerae bacterium]|nr:hypothetical protein [Phycisphaerae bacterium]
MASVVLCWGCGPAWAQGAGASGEGVEALEAAGHSRVLVLRGALSLGDEDLASAGLTGEQAEALLTALRSWYEAHSDELSAADRSAATAAAGLLSAWRQVNKGQAGTREQASALIAAKQTAAEQAEAAVKAIQAEALTAVEGALTV